MDKQTRGPLKNDEVWRMIQADKNPKFYKDSRAVVAAGAVRVSAVVET